MLPKINTNQKDVSTQGRSRGDLGEGEYIDAAEINGGGLPSVV